MTAAPTAKLGGELRAARRALGWEIPQLAESLRIRQPYLEAIENGRVADLPGTTYALGFVRAYANALGLDPDEVSRRFRDEASGTQDKPALRFPAPVPRRGVPVGALVLLGLVIMGGAYAAWYRLTEHRQTPVETVPPIPERFSAAPAQPAPGKPAPSPAVASILPAAGAPSPLPQAAGGNPPPPAATAPALPMAPSAGAAAMAPGAAAAPEGSPAAPADAPASNTLPPAPVTMQPPAAMPGAAPGPSGQSAGAAPSVPGVAVASAPYGAGAPAPSGGVASAPSGAGASAPSGAGASAPAGAGRIVIKATGDAWVTIKPKSGPAVLNKMMHAGDSFAVPPGVAGLLLTTGVASATIIEVDGAPMPGGLGGAGVVRRDVPLDPDLLKSGKLPPPPPRHPAKPAAAPPPPQP